MKKRIIAVFLFFALLIPSRLYAASDARMILANPGENANSEINLSWHMDENKKAGKVIYTLNSDTNWDNAVTINATYEVNTTFKGKTFNHYKVSLKGLTPNTRYKYKVGETTFSEEQYFKTGSNKFSFAWVSDWHTHLPLPGRTTANTNLVVAMLRVERNISMIFSTGDETSYGDVYDSWLTSNSQAHFKNYLKASVIGNHDYWTQTNQDMESFNFFRDVHNYPLNGYQNQEGISYYFKYGKTLFVILNSYDACVKGNFKARTWASQVIKNNPSDFVVVAMHYNWFYGDSGNAYQYNSWKDFFDLNNVDLALAGHNHIYVRTHRIYQGVRNDEKGTMYIQNASSDNDRGRTMSPNYNNQSIIAHRFTEGTRTVAGVIVNVDENSIKTRLVDRNGNVMDEALITKREKEVFDKETFMKSFHYYEANGSKYVSVSPSGVNNIESISYYDNDNLVDINYLYKKDLSIFKLDILNPNIEVEVLFRDRTTERITLNLSNNNYEGVTNLRVVKEDGKYLLKWDYSGSSENAHIFIGSEPYKSVNLLDKNAHIELSNPKAIVSLRHSENSTNSRYYACYGGFGDANFDGVVDEVDLNDLIQYYLNNESLTDEEKYYIDINDDGIIDLYDITYLHLHINGIIEAMKKEVKVVFLDMYGNELETFYIPSGSSITPPEYSEAGFSFIMWNKDLSNVSTDIVVMPVMGVN